jgi:histidinol-phosphate aminotransferase
MKPALDKLVRPDIAALEEYVPVEPIEAQAAKLGLRPEQIAKLDGNENPYGPSSRVAEAVAKVRFELYPDPFHTELREAIAGYARAPAERITFGNGSDELLELVIRLLLSPGDEAISCEPTFGMYSFLPPLFLGKVASVRRQVDFSVDVDAVLGAVTPRTKIIILASPNNPTGTLLPLPDLRRLLEGGPVVVVDEAYVEFAPTGSSAVPLTAEYDNLVVLRTFSKWAGLAGLRVGYGVFPAELVRHLWKIKQPYNVNVAAAAAVLASLDDRASLLSNVAKLLSERSRLSQALSALPGWQVHPSDANFLLCRLPNARATKDRLRQAGIIVRGYFTHPDLADSLRISVGLPEHTDRLIAALSPHTIGATE